MHFNCVKKNCTENWTECSLAQHRFPIRFVSFFFVSSVCLLVRVTVDTNKAVVCCLLATSAIMLFETKKRKRKMCSKKWYLKRNISCDAHLLNELLETDVPWDDAIVVSAGKLRKLCDFLCEPRSYLCEKTTGKDSSEDCDIACQKCAVYSVFPSGMSSHSKIVRFNRECTGPLIRRKKRFCTKYCV